MFKKVCIIGCGLIGSSLARAIKKYNLSDKIVSSNRSTITNKKVVELKIVDESSDDTKKISEESDLVVIAAPLSSYEDIIHKIKNSLKSGTILTDVGSVKKKTIDMIEKFVPKNVSWISSHPISGTEESGPEAGFAELFKNKWCILTPGKKAKENDIKKLKTFWNTIGSKVEIMKSKEHDYILSITSHLPHLIAYNIVRTVLEFEEEKGSIIKFSAGGLRDFTRIASSDPIMWRDIFIDNKEEIVDVLDKYIKNLISFKSNIENEQGDKLKKVFENTKKLRKEIIEAGQDIKKPDFGRQN